MTQTATTAAPTSDDITIVRDAPAVRRRSLRTVVLFAAIASVPFAVLLVRLVIFRPHIAPYSDLSLIEMNVRDIGHHPVLLGVYSRFGWHHLGPAFLYALAVPYRLFGSTSAAMYAGALLINYLLFLGCIAVAYRRGGMRFAVWTIAVLSLYCAALSPAVLSSPWNPLLALIAFVLFSLLAWSVAVGDIVMLPVGAGLASYLVQTHIGYLGVVGAVCVAGIVGAFLHSVPAQRWKIPLIISAVVVGVMWLPPLIQQVEPGGGNLTDVASWFASAKADHSPTQTTPIVLGELGAIPARVTNSVGHVNGHSEGGFIDGSWLFGVLTLLLAGIAAVVAWKRRATDRLARDSLWLFGMGGGLTLLAIVLLARVEGPLYGFITIWTSTIGTLLFLAMGAVVMPALSRSTAQRAVYVGAFAVIGVVALGNASAALTTNAPARSLASSDLDVFSAAVKPHIPNTNGTQIYTVTANRRTWPMMMGLVNQLERQGVRVKVNGWEYMVGERRTANAQPPGSAALVFSDGNTAKQLARDPANQELANNGDVWMFLDTNGH